MLPLSAETTPTTVPELAGALRRGFQEQKLSPVQIDADGADLSGIEKLHIDLSGTHLSREFRPPQREEAGQHMVEVKSFELLGAPIYFEKAPLEIRLVASRVKAGMDIKEGHGSLVVISATSGTVSVETTRAALETLLHSLAVEMAAKQGFEVRKTNLTFAQEGPRAVTFRAEITAKVFVMTASLALTGRLTVDDALNARISNLALDGDGMILKLAAGFARPHLDRLEGRVFPLLTFTPAGLSLRDVEMTVGESLRASAHFGVA